MCPVRRTEDPCARGCGSAEGRVLCSCGVCRQAASKSQTGEGAPRCGRVLENPESAFRWSSGRFRGLRALRPRPTVTVRPIEILCCCPKPAPAGGLACLRRSAATASGPIGSSSPVCRAGAGALRAVRRRALACRSFALRTHGAHCPREMECSSPQRKQGNGWPRARERIPAHSQAARVDGTPAWPGLQGAPGVVSALLGWGAGSHAGVGRGCRRVAEGSVGRTPAPCVAGTLSESCQRPRCGAE